MSYNPTREMVKFIIALKDYIGCTHQEIAADLKIDYDKFINRMSKLAKRNVIQTKYSFRNLKCVHVWSSSLNQATKNNRKMFDSHTHPNMSDKSSASYRK